MATLSLIRNKIVPVLTNNTSNPLVRVTAAEYSTSYSAYKAFNGLNVNSLDCWMSPSSGDRSLVLTFNDFIYINGLIITSRNTTILSEVYNADYDVYISTDNTNWRKIITVGTPSNPNTDKQVLFSKVRCKYIKLVPITAGIVSIGELNFYSVEEFYCIKQDGKYYSFHPSQYDNTTHMFKEITAADITANIEKEGILSEGYYFTSIMTDGLESFRPIDKFADNFQIISVKNKPISIAGLKSTRQLVVAKSDFSLRLAEHIDFFKAIYTLSDNCSLKMVVSIDQGKTYMTTGDNGITWTKLVDTTTNPLTTVNDSNWNTVRDSIFNNGFNLSNIENINFNALSTDIEYMRFAYVLDIDSILGQAINKSLDWQFDARGTMKLLADNDVDIEIGQYQIVITPKTDLDIMKINVGTGGAITINNVTESPIQDATSEDIVKAVSEVWL